MLVWTKLGPLWDGLTTYLELIKSGKTLRGPRKSHACFSVSHMDPLIIRILIEIETPYYNHEDRDEHQHLGPFPQTFHPKKKKNAAFATWANPGRFSEWSMGAFTLSSYVPHPDEVRCLFLRCFCGSQIHSKHHRAAITQAIGKSDYHWMLGY